MELTFDAIAITLENVKKKDTCQVTAIVARYVLVPLSNHEKTHPFVFGEVVLPSARFSLVLITLTHSHAQSLKANQNRSTFSGSSHSVR